VSEPFVIVIGHDELTKRRATARTGFDVVVATAAAVSHVR
jgi:hypothetical protein